jgi:hypothetical protein
MFIVFFPKIIGFLNVIAKSEQETTAASTA